MTLKYCTPEKITQFLKYRTDWTGTPEQLSQLVNYFAEGAVGTLSDFLFENIVDKDLRLDYTLMPGCRCLSCRGWGLVDENNKAVEFVDQLHEWIENE